MATPNRNHLNVLGKRFQSFACLVVLMSVFCQAARRAEAQTPYPVMRQLAEQAMELEHVYTGGRYVEQVFRYRLFRPQPYDQTKHYPLIIWLHGLGDRGTDNISHLNSLDATLYRDGMEDCQFFVLALQCPQDNRNGRWFGGESVPAAEEVTDKGDEMLTVMLDILNSIEREYPVDKDAISVVGISSGGAACWELLRREPQRFAAMTVLSASGAELSDVSLLAHTPIWAFHNIRDEGAPVGPVRDTIAAIREAGGMVAITEHDAGGHDSWRKAFAEYRLLPWLVTQRRGQGSPPPAMKFRWSAPVGYWWSELWPRLVPIGCAVVALWIFIKQLRGR